MADGAAGSVTAWIGLGANLGSARATLLAALEGLAAHPAISLRQVSPLYQSAPMVSESAVKHQPVYLNAVCSAETTLEPAALLGVLHALEQQQGRKRPTRWAPRTLDLDLLLHGDRVIATPSLTVPHPRLHERRFVLAPMADLAPDLVHPARGERVADMLAGLPSHDPGGPADAAHRIEEHWV